MLKNISNEALLAQVKDFVRREKECTVKIIEHLREIYQRSMHLSMCYPSMFAFVVKELGYSEAEAHLRIQAAKLSVIIPKLTEKIEAGRLSLSVVAKSFSEFRKEDIRRKESGENPLRIEEKKEVLEMLENTSRREAEEKLCICFAGPSDSKEYKFTAKKNLEMKLEALFDDYAHLNYERDLGKLIELLVDKDLKRIEKKHIEPERKSAPKSREGSQAKATKESRPDGHAAPRTHAPQTRPRKKRLHISIHTKRAVRKRDQNKCSFVNPETGRRCGSTHALEFDHVIPLSQGGTDAPENLTLLCDAHNRWKSTRVSSRE